MVSLSTLLDLVMSPIYSLGERLIFRYLHESIGALHDSVVIFFTPLADSTYEILIIS